MITYNVDGVKMPKIKKRDTSAWIRKVAASHGCKVGEIGYMFDDAENDGLSSSAHPVEGMWEEECEHCNTYHEDRCVIGQQLAEPLK